MSDKRTPRLVERIATSDLLLKAPEVAPEQPACHTTRAITPTMASRRHAHRPVVQTPRNRQLKRKERLIRNEVSVGVQYGCDGSLRSLQQPPQYCEPPTQRTPRDAHATLNSVDRVVDAANKIVGQRMLKRKDVGSTTNDNATTNKNACYSIFAQKPGAMAMQSPENTVQCETTPTTTATTTATTTVTTTATTAATTAATNIRGPGKSPITNGNVPSEMPLDFKIPRILEHPERKMPFLPKIKLSSLSSPRKAKLSYLSDNGDIADSPVVSSRLLPDISVTCKDNNAQESSRSYTGSELNRETAIRKRDRLCLTRSFREARNEPWLPLPPLKTSSLGKQQQNTVEQSLVASPTQPTRHVPPIDVIMDVESKGKRSWKNLNDLHMAMHTNRQRITKPGVRMNIEKNTLLKDIMYEKHSNMMNSENNRLISAKINSEDHSDWLKSRLRGRRVITSGRVNKELLLQEIKQGGPKQLPKIKRMSSTLERENAPRILET